MSEIENVGYAWMGQCNQLTSLPFNGFKSYIYVASRIDNRLIHAKRNAVNRLTILTEPSKDTAMLLCGRYHGAMECIAPISHGAPAVAK